jgi:hypothetical protein
MRRLIKDFSPDHVARTTLLFVLIALCVLTWRKWGYLPVDSGREMYVPAAISEGKRLYFDLWYIYGPLIPYWHAALFRLFGIHLDVLLGCGVSVVGITAWLLYSVSRAFLPVGLSFAAVFAFLLQAFQLSLFNYILPYAYPSAYGAMFVVLLLWLLLKYGLGLSPRYLVAAGVLAALMTLTKVEFGMTAYGGIGCALAIQCVRAKSLKPLVQGVFVCLPGVIVWAGIYGWYLYTGGAEFFLGENLSILPSSHFASHFGKLWAEAVGFTLSPLALASSAAIGLAGFGVVAGGVLLAARSRMAKWVLLTLALSICGMHVAMTGARLVLHKDIPQAWLSVAPFLFFNSGMIWVCVAVLGMAAVSWWRGDDSIQQQATILLCVLAIFNGMRVLVNIQPGGYSIYFGVLVYLVWLVGLNRVLKLVPVALDGGFGKVLAGIFCVSLVALTIRYYPIHLRPYAVSSERGTLYASKAFGEPISKVLAFLQSAKRASRHFVVMPEDTELYFFAGTTAPSRWYIVTGQVLPPGEPTAKYIEELERADIHYVVLSNRALPEFGIPVFGVDYGQQIAAWLDEHYRVVQRIGNYEAVDAPREWGVLVYERKPVTPALAESDSVAGDKVTGKKPVAIP